MKNQFVFREYKSGTEIPALRHATINISSDGLGWQGLQLKVGSIPHLHLDDVMVDGHLITFNLSDVEWPFELRNGEDWFAAYLPPQTLWINPEGHPFSVRHNVNMIWSSITIDGKYLDSVLGHHYELRLNIGFADDLLAHLWRSLIANLYHREFSSETLDVSLIEAFVLALATRYGYPAEELPAKGGIAPHHMKSLLSWLENHLDEQLTIGVMASRVGLSAAHFCREFKRSTGLTPWGYVVQQRLNRSHKLLGAGECLSTTALKCGFFDQSHMSRLFKQRFGVSPSVFLKENLIKSRESDL